MTDKKAIDKGVIKVCKRCVLNTGISGVIINEDGLCKECGTYKDNSAFNIKMEKMLTKKLNALLTETKSLKKSYDVLVLFSGGKDSAFLLNMVKRKYGLNPLAFSVMHPLVGETASKNMEEITGKLNVDLFKFYPDVHLYTAIMKYGLLEGHRYGLDESLGCRICSTLYMWPALKTAIKLGIPVVMDGVDKAESQSPIFIDGAVLKSNIKKGMKPFGVVHDIIADALKDEMRGSIYDYDIEGEEEIPALISPLTFIDYDFVDGYKEIESLGVESKKYRKVLTKCSVIPFFASVTMNIYGCVPFVKQFSTGIRNGNSILKQFKMENTEVDDSFTREAVLEILKEYEELVRYVVRENITKDGVSGSQREKMALMAQTSIKVFGEEAAESLMGEILKINDYAKFFNIELKNL
jgi:hypothetical protein